MVIRKVFFIFAVFISLPIYAWLYKVANPYDVCSCEPATIYKEGSQLFIKYFYKGRYYINPVSIECYDVEAQTLHIRIGSTVYDVAILEQ